MPGLVNATRSLFSSSAKYYSTAVGANVFRDGKYAEFVAAAADLSSIPPLQGLPEVSNPWLRGDSEMTDKK